MAYKLTPDRLAHIKELAIKNRIHPQIWKCQHCGKEFKRNHSGKTPKYCSRKCATQAQKKITVYYCDYCGKKFYRTKGFRKKRFCSYSCSAKAINRASYMENHGSWKGGKYMGNSGYVYIRTSNGKYKTEHVLIAESILRRPLKKGEVVHHVNGNKSDNRHCNLIICTQSYHNSLHQIMAKLYQQEHFSNL
jgi:endogenous inhibitor of DNA gyrase (YacG/DUF329 family)